MNDEKYILKKKKVLIEHGFTYSQFPNELSFQKSGRSIVFHTKNSELIDVCFYTFGDDLKEFSFNFKWTEFKDPKITNAIQNIFNQDDKLLVIDSMFAFIISNEEWFNSVNENEINDYYKFRD